MFKLTINENICNVKLQEILTENVNNIKTIDKSNLFEFIEKELNGTDYTIDEEEFDLDSFDGYEADIKLRKKSPDEILDELYEELDTVPTPVTYGPSRLDKNVDPKKIDVIVKNTFAKKMVDYTVKSDVGEWTVNKVKGATGKLEVYWNSKLEPMYYIKSVFFPNESNKISNTILKGQTTELYTENFEIYKIPLDYPTALRMLRKSYIPLLKNFINTLVIRLAPFNQSFVFWETSNPNFSYSFSSPKKNKVLLDLINFMSTREKPILDEFFEENNLRHKQGYLQNLLDASEAAGIFNFKRVGNEILIIRGVNYQTFLDGRLRRIQS